MKRVGPTKKDFVEMQVISLQKQSSLRVGLTENASIKILTLDPKIYRAGPECHPTKHVVTS